MTWLWSPLGGVLIGTAAGILLLVHGRIAGVSGIAAGMVRPRRGDLAWRALFLGGIAAGGAATGLLAPDRLGAPDAPTWMLILAGLLVGAGTRLGGGCTSGHGVCGVGRLSVRSVVATAVFMALGMATVAVVRHVLGGVS